MEDKLAVNEQPRRVRPVGPMARAGVPNTRIDSVSNPPVAKHAPEACRREPEVRVIKQGDRIESIVISCTCGEEITVICGYDQSE
ncbi:hypothetical protein LOC67_20485 [Stieleria sp. JC731]|uniref:hypothetical protein n=1 Tax=Pirellulaceae TaxID=2691357 RepID=UPI001E32AA7F|nr:hypothetical protein [Stieleria sp. JC731]MCC9602934.1 hypothetical protein [Stieleria sp. JC731]